MMRCRCRCGSPLAALSLLSLAYSAASFDARPQLALDDAPLSPDVDLDSALQRVDALALFQVRQTAQAGAVLESDESQGKTEEGEHRAEQHAEKEEAREAKEASFEDKQRARGQAGEAKEAGLDKRRRARHESREGQQAAEAKEAGLENHQHARREGREAKQLAGLLEGSERLSQTPVTTTSSESWFKRMQDSLTQFIIGIVLIVFSIPVLWFNENRAAQMESLISYAKASVLTVDDKEAVDSNCGRLVHIPGAAMHGAAKVTDKQFDVAFNSGCIRLRSTVEVYQVIQHEKKEEREKLGGGKETVTTYTYTEEWSSIWYDSQGYQDSRQKGRNQKPTGLDVGPCIESCSRVEFGRGFLLSDVLTEQCNAFRPAAHELSQKVRLKTAGVDFKKSDATEYFFYGSDESSPKVGDARVKFDYVPDGAATVLALQAENPGDRTTFLPYRVITRPWFSSLSEADEKRALTAQAQKSGEQLADEAGCTGCLGCLCCACNLVARCCSALLTPEICHLFDGCVDQYGCFKEIEARMKAMKWICRLVGWLMMFSGLYMLFSPFLTLITVLPLLGPLLAKLGGGLIWFLCFVTTLLIATAIVMLAYLFYHPLVAFMYGLVVTTIVVGTTVLLNVLS